MIRRFLRSIAFTLIMSVTLMLLVPGCVLKIGTSGETNGAGGEGGVGGASQGPSNPSGGGGNGIDDQAAIEATLDQADDVELAKAQLRAETAAYLFQGLVEENVDPAILDTGDAQMVEDTVQALADTYGADVWAQAGAWVDSLDPKALVPSFPVYKQSKCISEHGCPDEIECKFDFGTGPKPVRCVVTGPDPPHIGSIPMHNDRPTGRVLDTLAQLASPTGRPGARMLPRELMQEAFARFIEYAEGLRGDEHIDAERHLRALPFVRELAPILECWPLDAVPREVTLHARRAWDAWWPEKADPAFWDQTDRDAERWAQTKDGADEGVDREALNRSFRYAAALSRVCADAANDLAEQDDAALRLAITEEANRNAERRPPSTVAADLAGTMAASLNLAGVLALPRIRAATPDADWASYRAFVR